MAAACALPGVRIYQVGALPPRSGPAPILDPTGNAQFTACLDQQPNAMLDELRTALAAAGDPALESNKRMARDRKPGLGTQKKYLRRRARYGAGCNIAETVCGNCSTNGFYALRLR